MATTRPRRNTPCQVKPVVLTALKDNPDFPSPMLKEPRRPDYSPSLDSFAILQKKYPLKSELLSQSMKGKAGTVFYAETQPGNQSVVIKQQIIRNPEEKNCEAYRELRILQYLQQKMLHHDHFVSLLDWNKYWVNDLFSPVKLVKKKQTKRSYQCINFVFKDGGDSLKTLQTKSCISFSIFKEILFQTLFALYEAQRCCKFVHNDLHAGNILIKYPETYFHRSKLYRTYKNPKSCDIDWKIDLSVHVTIIDFGLSQITLDNGEGIYNTKSLSSQGFDSGRDVSDIASSFGKFNFQHYLDDNQITDNSIDLSSYMIDEQEHNKQLKRNIISKMKKGEPPSRLIHHDIFKSLQHDKLPIEFESDEDSSEIEILIDDLEEAIESLSLDQPIKQQKNTNSVISKQSKSPTKRITKPRRKSMSLLPIEKNEVIIRSETKKLDWDNIQCTPTDTTKPQKKYPFRSTTSWKSNK